MTFTKVGSEADFLFDRMTGLELGGKDILVAKAKGRFYALGNRCTHEGCRLSNGRIWDGKIRCPCHGSLFDPVTGKVLQGPAEKPLPLYHLKVENGQVWVDT
ncbi:MAG TPA: Rieske (2Fe-2S) protein [Methanomicrobiales archaeon]|jgi:nitrite reductase/ring-hydroxylating ferredoxin subunit|nr:Rieske (2Fe-2S) protein [Methanomicrobiales archaeon]